MDKTGSMVSLVSRGPFGYQLRYIMWVFTTGGKVNQSHYRPEVPRGFQEVKVPRLLDIGPGWW